MAYQKPYTFRAGTYAKAAEVNANFDTVKNFVDDLDTRITEGLSSSAAYNKANINGDSRQVFQAAQGSDNNDVVVNSQLTTINGDISSLDNRVTQLEEEEYNPPTYTNQENVSQNSTIQHTGVLVLTDGSNDTTWKSIRLNGTQFQFPPHSTPFIPVREGTTVGTFVNIGTARVYY